MQRSGLPTAPFFITRNVRANRVESFRNRGACDSSAAPMVLIGIPICLQLNPPRFFVIHFNNCSDGAGSLLCLTRLSLRARCFLSFATMPGLGFEVVIAGFLSLIPSTRPRFAYTNLSLFVLLILRNATQSSFAQGELIIIKSGSAAVRFLSTAQHATRLAIHAITDAIFFPSAGSRSNLLMTFHATADFFLSFRSCLSFARRSLCAIHFSKFKREPEDENQLFVCDIMDASDFY
jgi:hypothetical protein